MMEFTKVLASRSLARDILILLAVCYLAFWWRLGRLGLIDPDEPFYAQTVREMVHTNDWMTPQIFGKPQFEKPIFYYWLTGASFKVFGESEFAGRFASALPATGTVLLVFLFGTAVFGRRIGFLSSLVLATGLEFALMARHMLTDIALSMFLAGSLFSFWMALQGERRRNAWMFAHMVCGALAVLTKGPIGSLIPLLAAGLFLFLAKKRSPFRGTGFLLGVAAYLAIVVPWYWLMFAEHGRQFWDEFFVRDNFMRMIRAEHPANNHWFYYILVLLVGSIPWLPLVLATVWRAFEGIRRDERVFFLWCWILTSFVFLTLAASKLPSYIFFLFVPLALLMGVTLASILENGFRNAAERRILLIAGSLQCIVLLGVPFVPVAKPFAVPALLVAVCLGTGMILLYRRIFAGWIFTTVAAIFTLLVCALTFAAPAVERMSSAKPVALRMKDLRRGKELVLGSKYLVRGVYFYLQNSINEPVGVIADNPRPFWADHPLRVVVWNRPESLEPFLAENASALCAVSKSNWMSISRSKKVQPTCAFDLVDDLGANVIIRARRADLPR